jgi:hypothetical protein
MGAKDSSNTLLTTFCHKPELHNLQLSLQMLYIHFWMSKFGYLQGKSKKSHQRCLPFHCLYFNYCTLHVLNQYAQEGESFKIALYQSGAFLKFLYCCSKRMVLWVAFLHKNKHFIVFSVMHGWYCSALQRQTISTIDNSIDWPFWFIFFFL